MNIISLFFLTACVFVSMDRRGFLKSAGVTVASSLSMKFERSREEDVFDRFERRARDEGAEEVGFKEIGPRRYANAHFEDFEVSLQVREDSQQEVVFKKNGAFIGCRTVSGGFRFASEFESRVQCRDMYFSSELMKVYRFEVGDWVLVKQLRFIEQGESLSDRPNRVFVSEGVSDSTVFSEEGHRETDEIVAKKLSEKLGYTGFGYPFD